MLVDLYRQGRLDLDAFVTEEIGLDDVESAFDRMHAGRRAPLGRGPLMALRVDHAVVSGTFSLDGETYDVDNNIWVVGDDEECVVIDAPHDVEAILEVVGGRTVKAIVCTHAHDDHVRVAPAAAGASGVRRSCCTPTTGRCGSSPTPTHLWDADLADGQSLKVGRRLAEGAPHARPRPGRGVPLRPRPRLRLHRRHPLPGRAGCDRPLVQRRGPDRRVHPAGSCSRCPTRPSSTPGTATTPRSASAELGGASG